MGNLLRRIVRRKLRTGLTVLGITVGIWALADEPTGNLDSKNTAEVIDLLHRFNREHGQTIVLVTHDSRVGEACSRVLTMNDGLLASAEPKA